MTSFTDVQTCSLISKHVSSFATDMPAAPAPLITTFSSSIFFPTAFAAFVRAACITMAVPCWSSWKTGMPRSCKAASISKHLGAVISSRFIPPNPGAMFLIVFIISVFSFLAFHDGQRSLRPDVAQAEHCRAVRDNSNSVSLHRVIIDCFLVTGYLIRYLRDARRICQVKVLHRLEGHLRLYCKLPFFLPVQRKRVFFQSHFITSR